MERCDEQNSTTQARREVRQLSSPLPTTQWTSSHTQTHTSKFRPDRPTSPPCSSRPFFTRARTPELRRIRSYGIEPCPTARGASPGSVAGRGAAGRPAVFAASRAILPILREMRVLCDRRAPCLYVPGRYRRRAVPCAPRSEAWPSGGLGKLTVGDLGRGAQDTAFL